MYTKKEQLKFIKAYKKNKKNLEEECKKLWRKIVMLKAKGKCQFPGCNKTEQYNKIDAHHIYSKGRFRHMKYDTKNGLALCVDHHTFGKEAAHTDIFFKDKITGKTQGYKTIIIKQKLL